MIKELDSKGWEIGVHGSYNSFNDYQLLADEKKTLESIVNHEIPGIRQHYLNLNDNTWDLQRKAGFHYDSTLGFLEDIGFKDNKVKPFHPFDDDFLVIPLLIMDECFNNKKDRWTEFTRIADTCEQHDGVLVINYHQHTFNNNEFPGYKESYIQLIEKCKERKAQFFTLSQITKMYLDKNK